MVLLMFAYRTHQKWNARTCILLDPILNGKQVWLESTEELDGQTCSVFPNRGQPVSVGWHTLRVTHPKAKSYTTNLFIWYGATDLGQIALERATGTLIVKANPKAPLVEIRGPEFSLTLSNTAGVTLSVPTDKYVIEASYTHWRQRDEVIVDAEQSATQNFAPKLATLRIEASHTDVVYQLVTDKERWIDAGKLPTTIYELPEGNYRLIYTRKADQREMPLTVKTSVTNAPRIEFLYGAAVLESDPSGAMVYGSGRNELGITPLTLPELPPGNFAFTLRLNDYEEITSSLVITANQTNSVRTNLVSRFYTRAMERANQFYADKNFDRASEAAAEALTYKSGDAEAKRLQRDATGHGHLARAESLGRQGDYAAAIKAANTAIESLDESVYAKTLLADLTKREQERVEAEQKRLAELAEQKRKQEEAEVAAQMRQQRLNRLNTMFYDLNRTYSNAAQFISHELTTTNAATGVATAINNALGSGQPSFEIVTYEWPQANYFKIQSRHRIGVGYRECLIAGAQVQDGETKILWKVFEYENPPDLKLLNGLMTISGSLKVTSQDPQVEQKKAERFQERIKEGVKIVTERIKNASSN